MTNPDASLNVKIMPCLDMQNGRVVKGVQFINIKDAGDPVECCLGYCEAGADEIALLDITATVEGRATMLDVVRKVAAAATVPFTVGGGSATWPQPPRFLRPAPTRYPPAVRRFASLKS